MNNTTVALLRLLLSFACLATMSIAVRADEVPGRVLIEQFGDEWVATRVPEERNSIRSVLHSEAMTQQLPPLAEELHNHGGSYLYEPLDVTEQLYRPPHAHGPVLRLPEDWQEPQPLSWPDSFLGANPILWKRDQSWFGLDGYQWEPRFVGYGSYQLFAGALEDAGQRRDGIGHQLILDLDLALTGTERFHVQFRPLGGKNSGGSYYNFSDPAGYVDNSDLAPQRWWFEGELQSMFGGLIDDPTIQLDANVTLGKFPLVLQNFLLMNDEVTGVLLGKNNLLIAPFSNINVQTFYLFDDVDSFSNRPTDVVGTEVTADYRLAFLEATYIHAFDSRDSGFDADYFAFSATQFFGPLTVAGRAMFKTGDQAGLGDGQLYVVESSHTRKPGHWIEEHTGIELAVAYLNLFKTTSGWQPVAGGNFNRLRNVFTLNPLLQISAGRDPADTTGAAMGVQLFRHHEDESLIPEVAIEEVDADLVYGIGLQYERKLTSRIYLNLNGVKTWSDNPMLVREGIFASTFVLF